MIVFFYEKVRLKCGAWQTVSIVLLIDKVRIIV